MSPLKADKIIKKKPRRKWPKIFIKNRFPLRKNSESSLTENRLKIDLRFSLKIELTGKKFIGIDTVYRFHTLTSFFNLLSYKN